MMTAPREQQEDGQLQPALNALDDAIWALTDPQRQYIDGTLYTGQSLYMHLWDSVSGEQMNSGGGGGGKSRPPMWVSAFDLLNEIDTALEVWQPAFTGTPPTVGRLKCLRERHWRPMDTRQIEQIAEACNAWVAQIRELLDPKPNWSLPAPCPACQAVTVYRRDSGGEMVRQPALQIGPDGCFCARCKAHWAPNKFLFLANLLGYEKPSGLLE